jgi:hypothetical protein
MWYYNGRIINKPESLKVGGYVYNQDLFKDQNKLAELGIKPYRLVVPDSRYYSQGTLNISNTDNEVVGTHDAIGKDVNTLKEGMLKTVKKHLSTLLAKTDWYYLRKLRTGTDVPSEIQDYSDALYSEYDTKKTEINAMTKMTHIMEYENRPHTEVRKVVTTDIEGKSTYGPKTESSTTRINMCNHWTASPNDKVDPAFVSLTAD